MLMAEHAVLPVHTVLLIVIEEISAIPAFKSGAIAGNSGTGQFLLIVSKRTLVMLMALSSINPTLAQFVLSVSNFLVVGLGRFQARCCTSCGHELGGLKVHGTGSWAWNEEIRVLSGNQF